MAQRQLRLLYPATCFQCGCALPKGTVAIWDSELKKATCLSCSGEATDEIAAGEDTPIDRGEAGGSAAREWRRRHERREQEIRSRFGRFSGVVLALTDDPHATNAWGYGANGERALGKMLDPLRAEGLAVLHDRRIPGSLANIDHIVVGPWGVFVIDAKNYKGRVEKRDRGGWFSSDLRLYVGNHDKTSLVTAMAKQVTDVRTALGEEFVNIQVCKTICFVDADWSLFAAPFELDGVQVLWPRALSKMLVRRGHLTRRQSSASRQGSR